MRLCMASADGETAPALTFGMPLPRPSSSASSQALSLTGECDLGVRGVVRYTPHSRRPPVPTALTATLWDAPQHSETPQPGAGATVLQSWVDLLDQAAGSVVTWMLGDGRSEVILVTEPGSVGALFLR